MGIITSYEDRHKRHNNIKKQRVQYRQEGHIHSFLPKQLLSPHHLFSVALILVFSILHTIVNHDDDDDEWCQNKKLSIHI